MNVVPGPEELKALIKPEGRVEADRRLYCERYDPCLDEAVGRSWSAGPARVAPCSRPSPRRAGSGVTEAAPGSARCARRRSGHVPQHRPCAVEHHPFSQVEWRMAP
jgi:hypothetical protein